MARSIARVLLVTACAVISRQSNLISAWQVVLPLAISRASIKRDYDATVRP
jgi:hypothetical protein